MTIDIGRRQFISMLGGATVAWPLAALAQQPAMPVIGYLSSKGEKAEAGITSAIRKGLEERGFFDGRNVAIAYRWSEGDYTRLPKLAVDLVDQRVNVIAASGLPAALAAKAATSTIPIVFRLAIDPVAFDLAQSFDHPGGNITGVTMLFDPLTPKKIQLLHELIPNATSIGLLVDPKNQNAESHKENAKRAAKTLDLQLIVLAASSADEIETAFATGRKMGIGALLVGDDPLIDVLNEQLVRAAAQYQIAPVLRARFRNHRGPDQLRSELRRDG